MFVTAWCTALHAVLVYACRASTTSYEYLNLGPRRRGASPLNLQRTVSCSHDSIVCDDSALLLSTSHFHESPTVQDNFNSNWEVDQIL